MAHANSLRVIGQSLESARIATFELEKTSDDYLVKSSALTAAGEWILRNATSESFLIAHAGQRDAGGSAFRFTHLDISRLDSQWQKQRQTHPSLQTQVLSKLSQLMRSLGDHFDKAGTSAFHISWTPDSVSVDYQQADGESESRSFTPGKLQELGLHNRFRRAKSWSNPPVRPGRTLR
jgi:hypothetical protein